MVRKIYAFSPKAIAMAMRSGKPFGSPSLFVAVVGAWCLPILCAEVYGSLGFRSGTAGRNSGIATAKIIQVMLLYSFISGAGVGREQLGGWVANVVGFSSFAAFAFGATEGGYLGLEIGVVFAIYMLASGTAGIVMFHGIPMLVRRRRVSSRPGPLWATILWIVSPLLTILGNQIVMLLV